MTLRGAPIGRLEFPHYPTLPQSQEGSGTRKFNGVLDGEMVRSLYVPGLASPDRPLHKSTASAREPESFCRCYGRELPVDAELAPVSRALSR